MVKTIGYPTTYHCGQNDSSSLTTQSGQANIFFFPSVFLSSYNLFFFSLIYPTLIFSSPHLAYDLKKIITETMNLITEC